MKKLAIKFLPYEKFKQNGSRKFLRQIKGDTIILVDAKLSAEEEAGLIQETMKRIRNGKDFSGIELSSLDLSRSKMPKNNLEKLILTMKNRFVETIIGKKRGMTIIGPAKIVQKIERNPEELLLHM
jgi:hypothetical protein